MTMVFVPEGEFIMGADPSFQGINPDELPAHSVYLDAFWIDKTEVTNSMYAQFLNEIDNQEEGGTLWLDEEDPNVGLELRGSTWIPRSNYQRYENANYSNTDNYPVFEVTWFGAQAYCKWADKRLPTEAEWEKAARGVDGRLYPWGEEDKINHRCDGANVSGCGIWNLDVGQHPSGSSPYGAQDMLGNVWEWTADWYDENYYLQSADKNPQGPSAGKYKTIRGSSWEFSFVPITKRGKNSPELSDAALGFRCAADVN